MKKETTTKTNQEKLEQLRREVGDKFEAFEKLMENELGIKEETKEKEKQNNE